MHEHALKLIGAAASIATRWMEEKTSIAKSAVREGLARCVGVDKWTKIFILAFRPEVTSLRDLLSSHTG